MELHLQPRLRESHETKESWQELGVCVWGGGDRLPGLRGEVCVCVDGLPGFIWQED